MSARICVTFGAVLLAGCATTNPSPNARVIPADQQAFIEACEPWDEWSKPAPPFRIYGNSYYVGTCGLAAILITGSEGHVLIDGASRDGGPLIEANIHKLGFKVEDVKLLLHSHEHFDHVGGLAYIQERSDARMIASTGAAQALKTGETQPDDPQFGMHDPFAPVRVEEIVADGEVVSIGRNALIAMETPGHTPGALTWSWWSCSRADCKLLVYADSLSPISRDDFKFSAHPEYLARYYVGLERLAETPCDITLTPHPSASNMLKRIAGSQGLIDPNGCREYANSVSKRIENRLAEEADVE